MELRIDRTAVVTAGSELADLATTASTASQTAALSNLTGAYSPVSGLDQLGEGHGQVLSGGTGSAKSVLDSYTEQIEWLNGALNSSMEALTGQDDLFARGMDLADTGGRIGEGSVSFPQRPAPRFEPFTFHPPAVSPAGSVEELLNQFDATNPGQVSEAESAWNSMAEAISSVSAGLSEVAGRLLTENTGEAFEAAARNIEEVAGAGDTFAANARTMAGSVGNLNRLHESHRMQVALAAMSIRAIPDPAQRAAAEKAFLASFRSTFQADVMSGMPPVDNLMQLSGGGGAADGIALGMGEIAGTGEQWSAQGLLAAGANAAQLIGTVARAAQQPGMGGFGAVEDNLGALGIGDLATAAASTASTPSATLPGSQSPAGGAGGPGGVNGAGGMAGFGVPLATGMGRHALGGSGTGGGPSPFSTGLNGGAGQESQMGARTQSASAAGTTMTPMMGGAGAGVGPGTTGGRLETRQSAPAVGTGGPGSATPGAPASGAAGSASQSAARSMMPMMPMAGAGAGGATSTGKVKSVTSAVEEDRNIAALLGDRGPVVPGVIGDWVRG